ncbi:hypothetical protein SISSUDRAFT_929194 [Sistotremastrum suecicum HHB10207 ss-3]|uniref:Uncharacterized protein n=1 Tax=Sistotremastrum suecicum HHB10207 ss-3 TaxID=1314776 RepID=A0A166BSC0_9AGAM|nr:hypothetical protein SISSUDRAFT_929194 [Sistotremastrum suecicum HHB10207 ss-3]
MAPRGPPKVYQLTLKTHKVSIILNVPKETKIKELKDQAFAAIQQFADVEDELPKISSTKDFELCKAVMIGRKPTGQYTDLKEDDTVKAMLSNWERVYLRFRDSMGLLEPVKVAFPPIQADDDDEEDMSLPPPETTIDLKGKRKEHPE